MAAANKRKAPSRVIVDKTLLLVAVFSLVVIGIIMVYSVTSADLASAGKNPYSDAISQIVYALIGIVGAVLVWRFFPYEIWGGRVTWIVWGICMVLLLLTFAIGTEINGAKRWLYLGPIGMQPSEFVKVALLLMTIRILYDLHQGFLEVRAAIVQGFLLVLMPLGFLYATQSDLGTTLICFVGIFAVMWIGGINSRLMALIGIVAVVLGALAIFGSSYRSNRFVYLDPWNDGMGGRGDGYNIIRAYYALAEGGIFGVGIGNSHEKYQYLFASESDFIFAIIGEELGLVGALLVIGLFLLVLYCGLRITAGAPDMLGAMIAGGCTIMMVFQAFLNIGCSIGVFPTTGKPLPFISSGGTSMMSSLVLVGLVLSVERVEETSKEYEKNRSRLRVVSVNDDYIPRDSRDHFDDGFNVRSGGRTSGGFDNYDRRSARNGGTRRRR